MPRGERGKNENIKETRCESPFCFIVDSLSLPAASSSLREGAKLMITESR